MLSAMTLNYLVRQLLHVNSRMLELATSLSVAQPILSLLFLSSPLCLLYLLQHFVFLLSYRQLALSYLFPRSDLHPAASDGVSYSLQKSFIN